MVDEFAGVGRVIGSSSSVVDESPNVGARNKPPNGRVISRAELVDAVV